MAGRSSTSLGIGITIVILSVLSLGLFVTAAIYFGKFNSTERELKAQQLQVQDFVRNDERQGDRERALLDQARAARLSLVGYLRTSLEESMARVTGNRNDTISSLKDKLAGIPGAESAPLFQVVRDLETRLANLESTLKRAEDARQAALADQQNEVARVREIERRHQDTVNALTSEVDRYKNEIEEYRRGTDRAKSDMDARVARQASEFADRERRLRDEGDRLREENLVLKGQIQELRGARNQDLLRPGDESRLVDGSVVALDPAENQAIISIGSRQRVRLGMSFAVYPSASALRPDDRTGELPRPKATLEVINVGDNSSTCRITSQTKGNPVVKGDVIANAVFDPSKTYKFVVFGNFDTNRDGIATPLEQADLAALVASWGGAVVEDLGGDVDFLVLGERPVLPPRPPPGAPIEVVQEYIRLDRLAQRYDRLYQQAISTNLPVLNENRLYTLIGKTPAPVR